MPLREYTSRKACTTVLFLLLVASGSLRASAVVVPGNAASVEGNSFSPYPFDITPLGLQSQRYQQVYSSDAFFGPLTITDLVFRPDLNMGSPFSSTLFSIQIDLSTTSAAVNGLSLTFANNVGPDDTVVFGNIFGGSGALSLSSSFTGPAAGPKDFDIVIHLTTPFFYDPAKGNLLMDVRNAEGGTTTWFDAVDSSGDAVSNVFTIQGGLTAVLRPSGDNATTGGLVTEFLSSTPTPEPGSLALLLSGGLALAGLAQRLRLRP